MTIKKIALIVLGISFLLSCKDTPKIQDKEIVNQSASVESRLKNDTVTEDSKKDDLNNGEDVNLPFNFEEKNKLANLDKAKCLLTYPQLVNEKLDQIKKIIFEKLEDTPDEVYKINNGGLEFDTYVYCTYGDSDSQSIINVKKGKIIANESIGYAMPENETYQSFVINKDLSIDVFDINYNTREKSMLEKYQINNNGSIVKNK